MTNTDLSTHLDRHVSTLSIVLLTHATPSHLAAYAHCCKHYPLFTRVPVYATTPVISLGRSLILDLYGSTPLASTVIPASVGTGSALAFASTTTTTSTTGPETARILLPSPTPEEIATYFSLIHPLKYSQAHQPLASPFSPPLNGLTITAYNSGHTLGGAIWHLQHGLESIVYAVDWNQARENVIPGAAWLGSAGGGEVTEQLRKPTAMVCSTRGATRAAPTGGRKRRDDRLLTVMANFLARGGTVLIPTDSSARMIELIYLLEHAWRTASATSGPDESPLKQAKLYLAAKSVGTTIRYARSMLEWMDEAVVREFEAEVTADSSRTTSNDHPGRLASVRAGPDRKDPSPRPSSSSTGQARAGGPFDLQHVKLLERRRDVERLGRRLARPPSDGPPVGQVILASDTSMRWGFATDLFRQIASDPRNLVILTERMESTTTTTTTTTSEPGEMHLARLGRQLWNWWQDGREGPAGETTSESSAIEPVPGGGRTAQVLKVHSSPLDGNDLLVYQHHLATRQRLHHTTPLDGNATVSAPADEDEDEDDDADHDDDSSSSDSTSDGSDSERQGKAINISATLAGSGRSKLPLTDQELGVNVLLRRKGVYDFYVQDKKGRDRIFPLVHRRRRGDAFGEMLRPDEFLKAEERDDDDRAETGEVRSDKDDDLRPTLGQKRRWETVESRRSSPAQRGSSGRSQGAVGLAFRSAEEGSWANAKTSTEADGDGADEDGPAESDEDETDLAVSGPSKVTVQAEEVPVHLNIAFVDFAGLHDKRSLQMLIPLIRPRKLILVGGSSEETLSLAADCRRLLGGVRAEGSSSVDSTVDVFTPVVGTTVDASVDTNAWTVKLAEGLVRRLRWQHVRGLGVVHVHGQLHASVDDELDRESGAVKKQKTGRSVIPTSARQHPSPAAATTTTTTTAAAAVAVFNPARVVVPPPVLDVVPANLTVSHRSVTQPLHVGDLRLADLKRSLQAAGHTAEFRGEGTLLVDGLVSVRKLGSGRIEVEGVSLAMSAATSDRRLVTEGIFHDVRRRIYDGLAVVAGGA